MRLHVSVSMRTFVPLPKRGSAVAKTAPESPGKGLIADGLDHHDRGTDAVVSDLAQG